MFSAKKAIPVFILILMCFPGVMAQTVSFAEPDTVNHRDILLYGYNDTSDTWGMLASYNTTSVGIVLPNGTDVQFVIKPQYSNPLDNPSDFLTGAIGWLQTNVLALIIIALMGGLLFRKW
jgi:hypothetical protein